jgi:rhamnose transport system permease protein
VVPAERRATSLILRAREFGIFGVLFLFVLFTSIAQPRFLSLQNIKFILIDTTVFALLAIGETLVIVSRNVDLSVGSVLGVAAFVSSNLYQIDPGISIIVVFAVGIGVGLACGLGNGILVAFGKVPSLVVTLATLYIIRGLDVLIVGGNQVVANALPSSFLAVASGSVLGIPVISIIVAAMVLLAAYYLRNFRSGRDLYAIGSNPSAAQLVGIPTSKRVLIAFVISGALAGLAGVIWASYYGTINSTAGNGYELQVVAAVVVGGVAIFGGSGSVVGAAIGALLLNTINSALYVLGVSAFWDQAIAGLLLLVAISLDKGIASYLAKVLRGRSRNHGA